MIFLLKMSSIFLLLGRPDNFFFKLSVNMMSFTWVLDFFCVCVPTYMYLLFIYLVVAVLGLRCCVWASSSCSEWGCSLAVVPGLLVVASLAAG